MNWFQEYLESRGFKTVPIDSNNFAISCIFHEERTPSLHISKKNGCWYCWGCKESGAFYKIVATVEGISYQEAFHSLKEDFSAFSSLKTLSKELASIEEEEESESYRVYNPNSFKRLFKPLSKEAMEYLHNRRIGKKIVDYFGLRYGVKGKYRRKIIFPVRNIEGEIVSFIARSIDSKIFRKATKHPTSLFGAFEVMKFFGLKKFPFLLLVEGSFDDLYLLQLNVPVVSTLGTSYLTTAQIRLLTSLTKEVIFCYDADLAGDKALHGFKRKSDGVYVPGNYERVSDFLSVSSLRLPEGKDPDDFSISEAKKFFANYRLRRREL